ncbi:flavin reductase family protein [Microbacterium limosum]|uniref:Flavin reductase family protein n=1 Tax=Microbacterium limosum TaxID=3079935 RepID=A0AAU0MFN6_9MICO|nr:flavin reductase family protein [Microbacterium sp. Y20]WOQ69378.1 flavin reductase family protein [Microbacterium sp. Y20]
MREDATPALAPTSIEARRFRDALGHYASGLTVVTGTDEGEPVGFTCQSFSSVSIDPPLVMFSVMRTSTSYPRIAATGRFAVNVLAHDQHALSSRFARSGTDKWSGVLWRPSPGGNPLIDDTLLWVDCDLWAEHEAGDHLIVIGRVRELSPLAADGRGPLVFFRGAYRHLREIDEFGG